MHSSKHGFTLVELSIVLVILGLLVGGVLSGQSLIRASELRAVTSEFNNYQTAMHTFKDKYFAVPGDMPNAIRYWGKIAGGDADGYDASCSSGGVSTGRETCNGNGDGLASFSEEPFLFWQHLANAGLIEGTYTGQISTNNDAQIGLNVPRSKLSRGGWAMFGVGSSAGNGTYFRANYGNLLFFGGQDDPANENTLLTVPILRAEEAFNIDTKMDDGRPHTGKILTWRSMANCITADEDAYLLSDTTTGCQMLFISGM